MPNIPTGTFVPMVAHPSFIPPLHLSILAMGCRAEVLAVRFGHSEVPAPRQNSLPSESRRMMLR